MADNYLNQTGLGYYHNRIKTIFPSKTEFDALDTKVDGLIAEGGEPNVIETVKVNGTALVPDAQKAVDVEAAQMETSRNNGELQGVHIAQGENELRVFKSGRVVMMDGTDTVGVDLATLGYVDEHGGKIDKIQVNGTDQPITSKTVNIIVPETAYTNGEFAFYDPGHSMMNISVDEGTGVLTLAISDDSAGSTADEYLIPTEQGAADIADGLIADALANSGDPYQTGTQVQGAIDSALADVTGIDFQVVTTLPASGVKGTIYLVGTATPYDEYIWLEPTGGAAHWEQIGSTDVDLSGYWAKADLVAITTAQIDTLFA